MRAWEQDSLPHFLPSGPQQNPAAPVINPWPPPGPQEFASHMVPTCKSCGAPVLKPHPSIPLPAFSALVNPHRIAWKTPASSPSSWDCSEEFWRVTHAQWVSGASFSMHHVPVSSLFCLQGFGKWCPSRHFLLEFQSGSQLFSALLSPLTWKRFLSFYSDMWLPSYPLIIYKGSFSFLDFWPLFWEMIILFYASYKNEFHCPSGLEISGQVGGRDNVKK